MGCKHGQTCRLCADLGHSQPLSCSRLDMDVEMQVLYVHCTDLVGMKVSKQPARSPGTGK